MEHLALEIFDLKTKENSNPTGSQYANLPEDASITITDTSEIFASGDVWSHSFTLNIPDNLHIFGTSGDIHGSRLHEQINKRKTRLWVEGLPLYLGYLKLDDEVEVDEDGNVDVTFESGQKTFDEMIEGTKAREVSVGDVVIGVALNRKRVVVEDIAGGTFTLDGLDGYEMKDSRLEGLATSTCKFGALSDRTPYVQRWPKLVKSYGKVYGSSWGTPQTIDYTNIQTPYDAEHPFCNINICYPLKVNDNGEEKSLRGYTMRLGRGKETTDGSDNQTRFNNSPNFYLLYFIDRLFKDLNIYVEENQAKEVEDLRRVFMLNFGCHYEEIEDTYNSNELTSWKTPTEKISRYGQYYMPIISADDKLSLVKGWDGAGQYCYGEAKGLDHLGKVLLRNVRVLYNHTQILSTGSVEGVIRSVDAPTSFEGTGRSLKNVLWLARTENEYAHKAYPAYLAYATGDNYPNVDISEIIEAMKSAFGVRLLFSDDYKRVRIVLLRNIFRNTDVQEVNCEIVDEDVKVENGIRGFRMTYGKGAEDTNYYYKGFNDLFPRAAQTWKDTTDTHDYSQWELNAEYDNIKQSVSAFNKTCYVTPVNGNAHGVKVDEDEDVLFPSLFGVADFMDAEDGDCTGEDGTIEEVQVGATPVIMNEVGNTYAVLFSGDLKAPAPEVKDRDKDWKYVSWLATYGKMTIESKNYYSNLGRTGGLDIYGDLDIYIAEGFRIRLLDNYGISNGGTPFDEADPGLCFGVMRSSGSDAYIAYENDLEDGEGNDTWEIVPGKGAISHPDTCDNYGNLFDYNGSDGQTIHCTTPAEAKAAMQNLWPNSNIDLIHQPNTSGPTQAIPDERDINSYIAAAQIQSVNNHLGKKVSLLFATATTTENLYTGYIKDYAKKFKGMTPTQMFAYDAGREGFGILVEVGSSMERLRTLLSLQELAFHNGDAVIIDGGDNGVGVTEGRFSLKLRAEKLNPYYVAGSTDTDKKDQYLTITNKNLQGRGLCDQFYKEYSYWIRNARIVKRTVRMTLAQLLTIDKTVRVKVGDVTGFIRKMQYSVSNQTGLGDVTMEIMYI